MANNPYVNKVVYGNSTLIDLSQDTATQADVAQGKYFHLPTGERVQGTASGGGTGGSITQDQDGYLVLSPDGGGGGGGGLEYEEGTFSPSEDVAGTNVTINFANTHSSPPILVMITDATGTYDATTYSEYVWVMANMYEFTGQPIYYSTDGAYYQQGYHRARASTVNGMTSSSVQLTSATSDYLSNTYFKPYYSQSYYYRAGRTYKWIAVWAPTT